MIRSPIRTCLFAFLLVIAALAGPARADNVEEARVYVDKATAAYALNKYAAAAENFEKAFELKPDPALLYNAAQAYRLAGNKERALSLYESYLRVYPKEKRRPEIEAHIKQLKQAIERDKEVANSPPVTTDPVGMGSPPPTSPTVAAPVTPGAPVTPIAQADAPPPPSALPPGQAAPSSPVMLTQSADARPKDEPLTSKTWFWVAVGGGVVAAALVVVLLASGGTDPASASLGRVSGN